MRVRLVAFVINLLARLSSSESWNPNYRLPSEQHYAKPMKCIKNAPVRGDPPLLREFGEVCVCRHRILDQRSLNNQKVQHVN